MNKNNVVLSSSLEREINICTKNEETVTIFSEESNFDAAQISKNTLENEGWQNHPR